MASTYSGLTASWEQLARLLCSSQVCIFSHESRVFKIFCDQVVSHLLCQAEEEHDREDGAGPVVGGQQVQHLPEGQFLRKADKCFDVCV
jgi:hypothetical protein